MRPFVCVLLALSGFACPGYAQESIAAIGIVIEPDAVAAEQHVAEVLKARILSYTPVAVEIGSARKAGAHLQIHIGKARTEGRLKDLCAKYGVTLAGRKGVVNPEGYAVKTVTDGADAIVIAVGADERGVLYAAGEIVRRLRFFADHVAMPPTDVSTSPAFRFRGSSTSQGGTMMKATGARPWTQDEMNGAAQDYALAGANCFYTGDQGGTFHDYLKSFGLMTTTGARPNQLYAEVPPEWKAGGREGWEGKQWVCPSIPEAHAALMKQWAEDFDTRADHDVMRFYAGDPGGCTDERCGVWGKTFALLCEEMADLWHKKHPNSIVLIANQGLDNAGDQAIFDYYNEKPRPWSYGLAYGPGSNAMSPYFRGKDMRDDLFVYPGKGPVDRYLCEIRAQLAPDQKIMHYSDITHWISAQYQVAHPDPYIARAYGRRTFHARPRAMYNIFQAIMPFSEGDIIYSEGNHDEFHQYLWNRLLWNPNRELEDVTREYCVLHFGEEAADLMVQALLQLESSLETPLATNPGIARYYALVKEAGRKMPAWRMKGNYRWRLHMQKATLDRYFQDKLRIELDKEAKVSPILAAATQPGQYDGAIARSLAILKKPVETGEMKRLRAEAGQLGEETNKLHGDRNNGYARVERSFRDIPGTIEYLEKAQAAESSEEKAKGIQSAITNISAKPRAGRN